jgi:GBP family porin
MKKAVIAAACGMLTGIVHAQSSLIVGGIIDQAIDFAKGSQSQVRLRDGDFAASRLIFRGTEDLGDGSRAGFMLENGFVADTGAEFFGNNRLFGRQAWVEVGGRWGTVRLGRQYTPSFDSLLLSDAFNVNTNVSPILLVATNAGQGAAKSNYLARFDNMIAYRSPVLSGFSAVLAYAPGEAAGSPRNGSNYGANLMYAQGPLYLYYAYQVQQSGTSAAPVADPAKTSFHFVGGTYKIGSVRLGGTIVSDSSDAPSINRARHYMLSAVWDITSTNTLRAEVVKRSVTNSGLDPYALTLGWDHALSKRTALYTRAVYLHNSSGGATTINAIPIDAGSGDSGKSIGFGVRHLF